MGAATICSSHDNSISVGLARFVHEARLGVTIWNFQGNNPMHLSYFQILALTSQLT